MDKVKYILLSDLSYLKYTCIYLSHIYAPNFEKVKGHIALGLSLHLFICVSIMKIKLGHVAQSVTCLATDTCLTADPGVMNSIFAQFHTFSEIDHEIISLVILLPSAKLFKKGCCQ